jgi:hypothetical protein
VRLSPLGDRHWTLGDKFGGRRPRYRRGGFPNSRSPVRPSRCSGHAHTRHHLSPRGLNHRAVQLGDLGQCVAWRFRSYTIRQQRSASAVNPGQGSPGRGAVSATVTPSMMARRLLLACDGEDPGRAALRSPQVERGGGSVGEERAGPGPRSPNRPTQGVGVFPWLTRSTSFRSATRVRTSQVV